MALYLISYDIAEKNHDYQSLWDRLEELQATKILYSEWLYPHGNAGMAKPVADDLLDHMAKGDSLLVQEVGADAAWVDLKISDDTMRALAGNCRF
jgi:hypothetical protein